MHRSFLPLVLFLVAGLATTACGGGGGGEGDDDAGPRDSGSDSGEADAGETDAGETDAGETDAGGGPCSGGCGDFERCVDGTCVSYPGCLSMAGCDEGEVCRHRHCLPVDEDIDGDGSPAGEDCDETDPAVNPEADEVCNSRDDDCNEMVDDGDPGLLCADDPSGGICMDGTCGCPAGSFDLDGVPDNGCECEAEPGPTQGLVCGEAIDLGSLADSGEMTNVSGNVLPDDRVVWYRFRASDSTDTTCDNLHVRVQLVTNPGDTYEFTVFRGSCDAVVCDESGHTDFSWATDFQDSGSAGECPCTPPSPDSALMSNVSTCEDTSADYFVRVRRTLGSDVTCESYDLEISNGVYDS